MAVERMKTGIKALDDILDGGVPRGHVVLVAGAAGTGKTTLTQQIIFDGASKDEVGLYISMSEERERLMRNLEGFGFYDKNLLDVGAVRVVDISQDARLMGINLQNVQGLINLIRGVVEENGAKRVVIDSITAICQTLKDPDKIRDFVFELGSQLGYMGVTTFLISEIPPQTFQYSVFGIEEFISDGIFLLTEFERKGELVRAFQVIKMRGVHHSRNKYVMKILEDGVNLVPMFKAGVD